MVSRRRHGIRRSSSLHYRALKIVAGENEGAPEETSSLGDFAGGNFAANDGAGDDFPVSGDRRNGDDFESVSAAEFAEQISVAGLLVAEAKIFADEHRANLQLSDQKLFDKFLRRKS